MKLCFVTGSRADYGLLQPVIAMAEADPSFEVQIIASAMHLSTEFGMTISEIEGDGYPVDGKIEMLLSSDTPVGTAKSMGIGVIGFADAFRRLMPEIIVLLGDRFEALCAAQCALVMGIPIAHISGGDLTYGAFDDSIRHALTKLSHLHFTATEESARRVKQMGEAADRVFAVGDPGLDRLKRARHMSREQLEQELGIRFFKYTLLMTFHPATLDEMPAVDQLNIILQALDRLGEEFGTVITMPNADPDGRKLRGVLETFSENRERVWSFDSLGSQRYLGMLAECSAVVGNSSSGLLEAPSFGKPTVNIGTRQDGRERAASVVDVPIDADIIVRSIRDAVNKDFSGVKNPYGDGNSATRIISELRRIQKPSELLHKIFVEIK